MTTTPIDNTSITTGFNVDELTEGTLTGKGVFDVLLQTLRLHLDREFNSGRITGTAYATVYSQAITAFLAQAAQYAISKAKLPLELQLLQEQITLTQKQQYQITATIRQTDYITDYQLPADLATKNKQLALLDYDLVNIKPVELAIAQQDILLKTAQAALTSYDLTTIKPQELALLTQKVANETYVVQHRLPAEVAGIQAETALKAYELTDIKPSEKAQLAAQTSHVTKQELSTIQQTANLVTEQANMVKQGALVDSQKIIADNQALSITAETGLKVYELTDIKPIQKAQIQAETAKVTYETTYILPENKKVVQYSQNRILAETNKIANETVVTIKQGKLTDAQTASTSAQTALYAQKKVTELAQTVSTPAAGSVMGVQNDLMAAQKASYSRDAEQKAAKMLIDTWSVRHNGDPTGNPVITANRLRNEDIGDAVGKMLTGIGVA